MTTVVAVRGDLTTQAVDAIVNAANSSLLGGGGVDGAIHAAAGPQLLATCRALRREAYPAGLPVGQAVVTPGFNLPADWVVHTVGPNLHAGQHDPRLLHDAFTNSLHAAVAAGARTVAFPAISAGIYGWAGQDVARIAVDAVREVLAEPGLTGEPMTNDVDEVRFVLFHDDLLAHFQAALTH